MPRVLVVDDDAAILDSLRRALELEGFTVTAVADGSTALRLVAEDVPDAIVLDVGLPDVNGRVVAARIRAGGVGVPILVASAFDEVDERIAGLEAGADDYLVKPFATEELVARLRALLRRAARPVGEVVEAIEAPLRVGELVVDPVAARASWAGVDLGLTRRELSLLETLARSPDVVLSRDRLLELVWGYDFAPTTKVVDVFVSYVRRKLATAGAPAPLIETVRGVGFVLRRPTG
ncbi:MAG: two-component system, OmpR family, response regulator PrrA [Solirubrobacteraceae bacterium]|jgi:DNA-binding response OmpR family regulator|nr:two-component system, OmpR family, response regulator PrrA [Solirubrobacteraceae bacterium]